ncbi:hypothetical protein F4776DRAFT_669913 [Hypoxylon sp. NC0597]|nr:hypothetical protein F4776DRAFT_669913 [Hypoxylon sp. NC0597]
MRTYLPTLQLSPRVPTRANAMPALLLLFLALYVSGRDFPQSINSPAMFNQEASSNATRLSTQPIWLHSTYYVPTTLLVVTSAPPPPKWNPGTEITGTFSVITNSSSSMTETPRWSNTSTPTSQLLAPSTPGSLPGSYPADEDPSISSVITIWPVNQGTGIPQMLPLPLEASDDIPDSSVTPPAVAAPTQSTKSPLNGTLSPGTTNTFTSTSQCSCGQFAVNTTSSSTQSPPLAAGEDSFSTNTTTTVAQSTSATTGIEYMDQHPLPLPVSTSTTSTDNVIVRPPDPTPTTMAAYTETISPPQSTTTTATDTVQVHPMPF